MLKFMGRTAGLAFLAVGIVLTFTIATGLILIQLLGGQDVIDDAMCRLELSTECVREELAQERERLAAEEARLAGVQARLQELEAMYARLAALDHASESFALFYTDRRGLHRVVTGHRYASLIDPGRLVEGWCYIDMPAPDGVTARLDLARMSGRGRITDESASDAALRAMGLTREEFDAARGRCQWPDDAV